MTSFERTKTNDPTTKNQSLTIFRKVDNSTPRRTLARFVYSARVLQYLFFRWIFVLVSLMLVVKYGLCPFPCTDGDYCCSVFQFLWLCTSTLTSTSTCLSLGLYLKYFIPSLQTWDSLGADMFAEISVKVKIKSDAPFLHKFCWQVIWCADSKNDAHLCRQPTYLTYLT